MANHEQDRESRELEQLRRTRQERVDRMLVEEMTRLAPGNAAYWVAVVIGAFVINLGVLLAVAH